MFSKCYNEIKEAVRNLFCQNISCIGKIEQRCQDGQYHLTNLIYFQVTVSHMTSKRYDGMQEYFSGLNILDSLSAAMEMAARHNLIEYNYLLIRRWDELNEKVAAVKEAYGVRTYLSRSDSVYELLKVMNPENLGNETFIRAITDRIDRSQEDILFYQECGYHLEIFGDKIQEPSEFEERVGKLLKKHKVMSFEELEEKQKERLSKLSSEFIKLRRDAENACVRPK